MSATPVPNLYGNLEAERALVGHVIFDHPERVPELAPLVEMFSDGRTRTVLKLLVSRTLAGESIEPVVLMDALDRTSSEVGPWVAYVCDLEEVAAVTPEPYMRIVRDCAARRVIRNVAETLLRAIEDGDDVSQVLGLARTKLDAAAIDQPPDVDPFLDDEAIEREQPLEWVVSGWLPHRHVASLLGDTGVGKSLCAIGLALSIASDQPWHGCDVRAGMVIYIAAEGQIGLRQRVKAWKRHHGIKGPCGVLFYRAVVDLRDDGQVATFIASTRRHLTSGRPVAAIIIDTINANMPGGSENKAEDMSQAIANLKRLRDAFECTVLALHHPGHQEKERARGHSSFPAALDTELLLTKGEAGTYKLRNKKERDAEGGGELHFRLQVVDLGIDEQGHQESSAVLVSTDAPAVKAGASLRPSAFEALKVLVAVSLDEKMPSLPWTVWLGRSRQAKATLSANRKTLLGSGFVERTTDPPGYRPTENGILKVRPNARRRGSSLRSLELEPNRTNKVSGESSSSSFSSPPLRGGELNEPTNPGTAPSQTNFLRLLPHDHACPTCSRPFRCTAPECAGRPKSCAVCRLQAIRRGRRP
jgi:hypothetical protein